MHLSLALLALSMAPSPDNAALDPAPQDAASQGSSPFAKGDVQVGSQTIAYRLLPPAEVEEGERYPLVLFLHGSGERGSDNTLQLKHFPERMATDARRAEFPCFLLAPQCPKDERWTMDEWGSRTSRPMDADATVPMQGAIKSLIEVVRDHPVDTSRIYLTGLSMGGYGTFELAARHPDWFAAAIPVCGGGDERQGARLAGLPMSIWHGDADDAVPVERSRQMVAALKALGESPSYTELPGVGHNAWDHAYVDGGCLPWMFAQRRDPARRLRSAARLMAEAMTETERVVFLGDSITEQGTGENGYVTLLRDAIAGVRPGAKVFPAGISGHKVPNLLAREERDVRSHKPTLVFTYIGINDVWHSQDGRGTPSAEFEKGLETLMARFEAAGAVNVLATPSVIGEKAAGLNSLDRMLIGYSEISRATGSRDGRVLCDLQTTFRDHGKIFNVAGKDRGVLTNDGVHLNEAGNLLVATEAALALRKAALAR